MQEKSTVFKDSKNMARPMASDRLMQVTVELLAKCTTEVTRCCEAWTKGEDAKVEIEFWHGALRKVIERMGPVHSLINLEVAQAEEEAFVHTAELAIFAAISLRKDASAPASSTALLAAPSSASWPAGEFLFWTS